MSELGTVLSTKTLGGICAREYLGSFACIAGSGYSCTCDNVVSLTSEVVKDGKGAALVLSLELAQYIHDTKSLVAALALTGYRFDWKVSAANLEHGTQVQVTYDLFRNENKQLRTYVLDTMK